MLLIALMTWVTPALAQPTANSTITVGSVVNGTSGGVVVGPPEQLRARLLQILGERGINAMPPASEKGGQIDAGTVRFVLNGVVTAQACQRESHWTGCRWRVQWSVLDRLYDRIALETVSSAEASVKQSNATSEMYVEIVARSLLPLARTPELRAVLQDTTTGSPLAAHRWAQSMQVRPCPAAPLTLPADIQAVRPALFTYETPRGRSVGSLISPDGVAITSARGIGGLKSLAITFADEGTAQATVVRVDAKSNAAVLHVPGRLGPCLEVDPKDQPLGTAINGLGTRDDGGKWGLRAGLLEATVATPRAIIMQTNAVISDLAPGSALLNGRGAIVGLGQGAAGPPVAIVSSIDRLGIAWNETTSPNAAVSRTPVEPDPVTIVLESPDQLIEPPIGPGRSYQTWADVPGATETIVGGGMIGAGLIVAVTSGVAWSNQQGGFDVDPRQRATFGALTGIGLATAAGGGFLLNSGLRKSREAGTEVRITSNSVNVSGRF